MKLFFVLASLFSSVIGIAQHNSFLHINSKHSDTLFANEPISDVVFKNGIYAQGGTLLFTLLGCGGYERLVYLGKRNVRYFVGAGIGQFYVAPDYTGPIYMLDAHIVTGTGKNHFETMLGAACFVDLSSHRRGLQNNPDQQLRANTNYFPLARFGYRYQYPGKPFFFRTGLGIPDGLYVSFGFSLPGKTKLRNTY